MIRKHIPDATLRTTIIVGFPGETEEDFQDTLSMIRRVNFVASYSFCYSPRPGTRAALFPDKIDKQTKTDRLERLQALQEETRRQVAQRTCRLHHGSSAGPAPGRTWTDWEAGREEIPTGLSFMWLFPPAGTTQAGFCAYPSQARKSTASRALPWPMEVIYSDISALRLHYTLRGPALRLSEKQ